MKVLMPVLHYPPVIGGFEVFIQNICERMGVRDDIFVITGKVRGTPRNEQKHGLRIYRDASWHELQDLSYSTHAYLFGLLVMVCVKSLYIIKKERIELIHAQGFLSGVISLILSKLTRIPYVITIQSADFSIYHAEIKQQFLIRCQRWIEKKVYQHAHVCHAVSHDLAKHYAAQGRHDAVMIPNGVETELFFPIPDDEKKQLRALLGVNGYLVSCVSRLQEKNGTHILLQAIALLKQRGISVTGMVIGNGVERERLERMVRELDIEKEVRFLGDIAHEQVGPYVAASDVFVRPSLAEGFGIVYLEAMACGVPVIGTPVGGIVDFLHHEQTGLMAKPGDASDLAVQINRLLTDQVLRQQVIEKSASMIRASYAWDAITEQVRSLYDRALNRLV